MSLRRFELRLHLTNVAGLGATQLLLSLLPALERSGKVLISSVYLPDCGPLSTHKCLGTEARYHQYKRVVPNSLSRFLECSILGWQFNGTTPILVLGDMPIRCSGPQVVFVQTPHLVRKGTSILWFSAFKYRCARLLFRFNKDLVKAFIVQTSAMKRDIVRLYPELAPKVHILPQPVPHWLASVDSSFCRRKRYSGLGLKLFYPAASYPHKNHSLLSNIAKPEGLLWPVNELVLTLDKDMNPAEHVPWVRCIGIISGDEMVKRYQSTDALLFLSKAESYGFPLVEAMYVGLPVVCPRLDYAIELCGQSAIYFDPDSIESLKSAIEELQLRLNRGWRPDWTEQLVKLPKSWDEVAERMINICFQEKNVLDENQNLSSLAVGSVRRSYSK